MAAEEVKKQSSEPLEASVKIVKIYQNVAGEN